MSDFAIYDNLRYKFTFPLSTYQNKIQHIIYLWNETPIFSWAFSPNSLGSRYDHVAQTWPVRCVTYSRILPESPLSKFCLFVFSCAGSSLLDRPPSCWGERGCSLLLCVGFPSPWLLLLWGSALGCSGCSGRGGWAQLQSRGSIVAVHRLSCSGPVRSSGVRDHTQVDSLMLSHQGSPWEPL